MAKWEYCAVAGIYKFQHHREFDTTYPAVWYFTLDGVRTVEITGGNIKENIETARVIAQLGEEGWEMTGCATMSEGTYHILYFKRVKP